MTTPENSWSDLDIETLQLLHDNLRQGLRLVAEHIDAGTFNAITPGKSSPPSESGQITMMLFNAVEAELARRTTDAINADPNEVAKLRQARQDARTGRRTPLHRAIPEA